MTFRDDNGNELEFGGEFAMTKQAVSFFNGAIKGDVSINFTVDNNSVNRKILNYYGPQMTSQVAFTKQAFNRVRNGNILDRGYIVIQDEEEGKLNCFYVSGNSNWVQKFKGLITDLSWPLDKTTSGKYKFYKTLSYTDINNSDTEGIIFPLVDWSYNLKKGFTYYFMSYLVDNVADYFGNGFTDFYPCLYYHSLIYQISNETGVKFSGNLFTDPIYRSLVIPPKNGYLKGNSFTNITAIGSSQGGFAAGTYFKYSSFTETQDPENLFNNNIYTQNKYSSVNFTVSLIATTASSVRLEIFKNGVLYQGPSQALVVGDKWTFFYSVGLPGDYFEVYARNMGAGTQSITLNLEISVPKLLILNDIVNPNNFLPSLKMDEVIKFLFYYFGCSVYYDEFSKTITATIVENIKTESAFDWSEYYLSHRSEYTVNQAKNNYIRFKEGIDTDIKNYNKDHIVNFGDGNITTGNTLKEEIDLYEFPFIPSSGGVSKNGIYHTNIPLINFVDEPGIPFTAMASVATPYSSVSYTISLTSSDWKQGEVVRITDANGFNRGYFTVVSGSTTSVTIIDSFSSTGSGIIYRQKATFIDAGPRLLSVKPLTNVSDFSSSSSYTIINESFAFTSETTATAAIFTKQRISDAIDQWSNNLAIDNPDSGGFTDPTIKQLYFNKISKFLQNPNIRAKMLLPEAVYQSFVFDQFIYLRTENLTGYFFVDSIVNYVDGNTPVEVNLYML